MNRLIIYPAMVAIILASFATFAGAASVQNNQKCSTGIQTVYVGHTLGCPHTGYNVTLTDLSQPNANGISSAVLNVYYSQQLVKIVTLAPGQSAIITGHGAPLIIHVRQTFAGLYAYQKWAKMSLTRP